MKVWHEDDAKTSDVPAAFQVYRYQLLFRTLERTMLEWNEHQQHLTAVCMNVGVFSIARGINTVQVKVASKFLGSADSSTEEYEATTFRFDSREAGISSQNFEPFAILTDIGSHVLKLLFLRKFVANNDFPPTADHFVWNFSTCTTKSTLSLGLEPTLARARSLLPLHQDHSRSALALRQHRDVAVI